MRFSLIPQSIFGRLLAALLLVATLTVAVITLLIARERRELAIIGSEAFSTVQNIVETSTLLAQLDDARRQEAIERFQQDPILVETVRPRPRAPTAEDMRLLDRMFARRLHRLLGPEYHVRVDRDRKQRPNLIRFYNVVRLPDAADNDAQLPVPPPRLPDPSERPPDGTAERRGGRVLHFRAPHPGSTGGEMRLRAFHGGPRTFDVTVTLPDGEDVSFRTAAPQRPPPLPRGIYLNLGILTVAVATVLFLMTRTITRPLSELARAADAMGRGASMEPLKERGARELRDATRAFNAMQDRLRRYLDSRTRVLTAISHDLRTPLTRLRLRAESIDDEALRTRFTADLDEMAAMVNGALGMFRGLNEAEPLEPIDIDAMLATLETEFAEMGAEVTIDGRSQGPIAAKPQTLKRCLTNLLRNAVDYGTRATVHVSDGRELILRICDEGPGIPEAELEKVFEPFYRVESSRSRDTGGTGLGLSIARDVAQAHGGSIHLRNLPERGLEVTLTLPRSS